MKKNDLLSLIVPVYFEEDCIGQFVHETVIVLESSHPNYEIIFIDDGSKDNTCQLIEKEIEKNSKIKLITFSYNHGKQAAVTAGIVHAKGDLMLYMDPDLQDPPNEIPRFLEKINQGYDLVFGIRNEKKDSLINKWFSSIFWSFLSRFTNLDLPKGLAVMRIFNRAFADEFIKYEEQNRFIEGIFMNIRKRYTVIEIEQRNRFAGVSKFNFSKKMLLAVNAIFDYSDIPLQISMKLGLLLSLCGALSLFIILILKLFYIDFQAGWPSIVSTIVFGLGFQLFFLGIIARYIGSIYKEVKKRPLYSIMKKTNFE